MTVDISRFFTNMDRSVYALKDLPEEVVAYLFARYSRSSLSLREDLRRMIESEDLGALIGEGVSHDTGAALGQLQERARTFAEKYVLGYGHGSVAEHGCVHLALEDVSIIASKLVEDGRLASYTEKSTRYVAFDRSKMYDPPAVSADPCLAAAYSGTLGALLDAYTGWTDDFIRQIKAHTPRSEKQSERGYDAATRATAFDILRYLLPAATFTNIGLTLNARALETLITKLLSQPLLEGRELGARIKAEAQHIVPTLLKYAEISAYRADTDDAIARLAQEVLSLSETPQDASTVTLIATESDADDRLVAAILYGAQPLSMSELLGQVCRMDAGTKERVVDEYLRRRGRHDAPGRALERIACTIEMTMDYGAYRDVQRHRMATQTLQPLSPALGWVMPREMERFGYADRYKELMTRAAATYAQIAEAGLPQEAAYVLPLATRVRALFTWNLREVTHFVELRSARQGHPAYRKVAQDVYRAIAQAHPLIARYMRPNMGDYGTSRD
jgi:thymidylate synthase ThyX